MPAACLFIGGFAAFHFLPVWKAETMKEEIKGLEYQIDTLKNDLKDFKRVYKSVRDIKYTYQQIDGLKGKKSVLK